MPDIDLTPEQRQLRESYQRLKQEFADLFLHHQEMTVHERPTLIAIYLQLVGQKQFEVFCLQTECSRLKRKMELLQIYVNRNETPDIASVDNKLEVEFKEYSRQIINKAEQLAQANAFLSAPLLSKEETEQIKKLYYNIAKILHPDVNPDATDYEKNLFIKAQLAYEQLNLEELKQIMMLIELKDEKTSFSNEKSLAQIVSDLQNNVNTLKLKIENLESAFPFIHREHLKDEAWIKEQNESCEETIKSFNEAIEKYKTYITLLEEWKPKL